MLYPKCSSFFIFYLKCTLSVHSVHNTHTHTYMDDKGSCAFTVFASLAHTLTNTIVFATQTHAHQQTCAQTNLWQSRTHTMTINQMAYWWLCSTVYERMCVRVGVYGWLTGWMTVLYYVYIELLWRQSNTTQHSTATTTTTSIYYAIEFHACMYIQLYIALCRCCRCRFFMLSVETMKLYIVKS